ncbi:uncharacterized protein [Palaemon carinicauda]|uniref:uncharacterized protein n=1 Tax=Palaemon carinicauda TaxID=392227 RepID=UPI0035B5C37C
MVEGLGVNCPDVETLQNKENSFRFAKLSPYLVAVTCTKNKPPDAMKIQAWDDEDMVKVTRCVAGEWIPFMNKCTEINRPKACHEDPPVVANASISDPQILSDANMEPLEVGKLYRCNSGHFLSGEPARLSTCSNGWWTDVYDYCGEGCPMPKDCSQILYAEGVNSNYRISPSERSDLGITVSCMNFSGDPGWTLVSRFYDASDDTYDEPLVSSGYGSLNNDAENYFIGMHYLLAMAQHSNKDPRPLVFLFVMEDEIEGNVTATYTDVTINNDTFEISFGGEFSGSAGNCWKNLMGPIFLHPHRDQKQCTVMKDPISWSPLTKVIKVTLYIRPQEYDAGVACPVIPLDGRDYPNMDLLFPIDRLPGDTLQYICPEQFLEQSTKTPEGNITCTKDPTTGVLAWDRELVLPCLLYCPDNFLKTLPETHCLHFTETPETFGVYGAALSCRDLNASLNFLTIPDELQQVPPDNFYYTSHYSLAPDNVTLNPTALMFPCVNSTQCLDNGMGECLATSNNGYTMTDCYNPTMKAMCRLPVLCPDGYTKYRYLCYRVICPMMPKNISYYLHMCQGEGSALAYPETVDVLHALIEMVKKKLMMNSTVGHIELGLNDASGDWTHGGLYELSQDMQSAVGTSMGYQNWRKLMLDPPGELQGRSYLEFLSGCGVCQYLARVDCWEDAPEPMEQMTRMWDGQRVLGTFAIYNCYPGYFMGGNLSISFLTITCAGQLGNWFSHPPLNNCIPVDVCLVLPPPPHPNATVEETMTSRYLNGTVSFVCPGNLTTQTGLTVQNVTCVAGMMGMFNFFPMALEPCHEICRIGPTVINATSDWNSTSIYIQGSVLNGTCEPGHQYAVGNNTKNLTCIEEDLWENISCYLACEGAIPIAGNNMTAPTLTANSVGTVLVYTCDEGLFRTPNDTFPDIKNETIVECSANGSWIPMGPLSCEKLCLGDPPSGEPPFISNWDGTSRSLDTTVNITCEGFYILGDLNKTHNIVCTDGTWTEVSPNVSVCIIGSIYPPSATIPDSIGAVLEGPDPSYLEGDQMNYTCQEGKLAPMGVSFFTVTFTADGWTEVSPEFICYNVSYDPPVISAPGTIDLPPTPFFVGSVANFTCPEDTLTSEGLSVYQLVYQPDGWTTLPEEFKCLNVTYLPPVLPSFALKGGTFFGADPPFHVGQKIAYRCLTGYISTKLDDSGNVVHETYLEFLGGDQWSELDPEFVCVVDVSRRECDFGIGLPVFESLSENNLWMKDFEIFSS